MQYTSVVLRKRGIRKRRIIHTTCMWRFAQRREPMKRGHSKSGYYRSVGGGCFQFHPVKKSCRRNTGDFRLSTPPAEFFVGRHVISAAANFQRSPAVRCCLV